MTLRKRILLAPIAFCLLPVLALCLGGKLFAPIAGPVFDFCDAVLVL